VQLDTRIANGPLLLVVEHGPVEVVVNFEADAPTSHDAGTALIVEGLDAYWIANLGAASVSLLVVSLEPPGGLIGPFGGTSVWEILPPEQEQGIARERIAVATIGQLSPGETVIFLACLLWTGPAAELASSHGYPGPIGFLVLRGQLEISTGDEDRLGPGDCVVVPRYTTVRASSGGEAPLVLVMGAVPADGLGELATPETGGAGSVPAGRTVDCTGWPAGQASG
jgi:hypothetical protein